MILQRHGVQPVKNVSEKMLRHHLAKLRLLGKSRFLSLTDDQGNWLQVGGGERYCFIERRDAQISVFFRGWQKPSLEVIFPDPVTVTIAGGTVSVRHNEWFRIAQVVEVFTALLHEQPLPGWILWRDISEVVRRNMSPSPERLT